MGCNVNKHLVRVALLMEWSDESDCVCLCDISVINELHYRVLMYRFVTEVAKNVTVHSIYLYMYNILGVHSNCAHR